MKVEYPIAALLVVMFAVTIIVYPYLPDPMVIHWGPGGEADGYMDKIYAAFMIPIISIFLAILLIVIPRYDKEKAIKKFQKYYDMFIVFFMIYMLVIQLQILSWNLGYEISPNLTLPILFSGMFYFIALLMENIKQNNYAGIRTPWTLKDPENWDKTHKLGGKLFKVCSILTLGGIYFSSLTIWLMLIPVLSTVAILFVYSYYLSLKK